MKRTILHIIIKLGQSGRMQANEDTAFKGLLRPESAGRVNLMSQQSKTRTSERLGIAIAYYCQLGGLPTGSNKEVQLRQ